MLEQSRITAEYSLEANYLKICLNETEKIDGIAIHMIKNDRPDFLLPMKTIQFNNVLEFKYTMGNQTAVEYKEMICNKKQFLHIYKALIDPFIQCGDWLLDYHYLYINSSYVFVDKNSRSASYLYIPADSAKNTDSEILKFFSSILNRVTITDDASFLLKLYQSFSMNSLTLVQLHQFIEKELQPNEPVTLPKVTVQPQTKEKNAEALPETQPHTPQDVKRNLFGGSVKQELSNVQAETNPALNTQDDAVNILFGSKNKRKSEKEPRKEKTGGLWGKIRKKKELEKNTQDNPDIKVRKTYKEVKDSSIPIPAAVPAQPQVNYNYTEIEAGNDYTEVGDGFEEQNGAYLQLLNDGLQGMPFRIELDLGKPQITLGRKSKDMVQPDVAFPQTYKRIGRMHACIRKENDTYYLVDLGSINGSALNGKQLVPNHPYPLHNQDEISFVVADPIKYRVFL